MYGADSSTKCEGRYVAIVHAQRRNNGFGGIGRGYSLNKLHEYAHNMRYTHGVGTTFFYIEGPSNPADTLSRYFGAEASGGQVVIRPAPTTRPLLTETFSPVAENIPFKGHW